MSKKMIDNSSKLVPQAGDVAICHDCGKTVKGKEIGMFGLPKHPEASASGTGLCKPCLAERQGKMPTRGKWRLTRWTAEDQPEDNQFDTRHTWDVVRGDKSEILGIFEIPNPADARLIEQAPVLLALVKEFREYARLMLQGSGEDTGEGKLIRRANVLVNEIERVPKGTR